MHRSIVRSALLASFLFALRVVALVSRAPFGHMLVPRQAGVCDSACSVFENALNGCTTLPCLCNAAVANGLQSCVNCVLSDSPTSDLISTAQQLVNTYLGQCPAFTVTVPSGNGGGTGVSSSTPVVVVPSTSKTTSRTTTSVIVNTPSTTTTPAAGTTLTTSTAFTTVPTTFGDGAPSISQSTVRPSAVNGPADGTQGGPTTVVQNGPTSGADPQILNIGPRIVLGCILGMILAV